MSNRTSFPYSAVVIALLGNVTIHAQGIRELSPAQIAARATPATVTILAFTTSGDTIGQGSGFLVRSSGVVVTNWHVVAGASAATIILASGERYTRVLYLDSDSTRDVALLQIPGAGLPVIPVRDDLPPPGSRVVVIGSPLGLARTVTDGIVSATRIVQGRELVQVSAPISHGSSGGPVLDSRGRAFAIASAFLAEGQQVNFAVPVRYAMGLLALQPSAQPLSNSPAALAPSAGDSQTSASPAALVWAPTRASSPRPTLGGTYTAFRWAQTTLANGTTQAATTAVDLVAVMNDGAGWRGYSCDSVLVCNAVGWVNARTAPSGDVVLDHGYVALDGYQTDSGFVVRGQFTPASGGNTVVRLRAWSFVPALSQRAGLYSCDVRTQYTSGTYRGDFLDWTGQAVALETADSTYLQINLTNSSGGTTGGAFVASRNQGSEFHATTSTKSQSIFVNGHWSFGRLSAEWDDFRHERVEGEFVGPLTCDRR